jgi:hypothetical protein
VSRRGASHRAALTLSLLLIVSAGCSDGDTPKSTASSVDSTRDTATDPSAPTSGALLDDPDEQAAPDRSDPPGETVPSPNDSNPSAPSSPANVVDPDSGEGAEELGPLGSTEVEIDTGDGTVQIGSGELPAMVPDDFPLPSDFEMQLASETGDDAGFSGVTALAFGDLVDFYRTEFADSGYRLVAERVMTDSVAVFEFESDAGSGEVAISSAPGGERSVLVTFAA